MKTIYKPCMLGLVLLLCSPAAALSQTVNPSSIDIGSGSAICTGGSETQNVSIAFESTTSTNVDVFLLFDDTGSYAGFVSSTASVFSSVIADLEAALPGVEFGFGVGRFEDYGFGGWAGSDFASADLPFILNQPIVTTADAGGVSQRDNLISDALSRTGSGGGVDAPESAIAEGLYQLATGAGFDGDGDGSLLGNGAAGSESAQGRPLFGFSNSTGDVPPLSSLLSSVPSSGTLGGAGWRSDAQKIVILATDVCSIAAYDPSEGIPTTIAGTGSTEPSSAFNCTSSVGSTRFGFIGNAKAVSANTQDNAVSPAGAGTVPATIEALNNLGIQVVGLGPSAAPTSSTDPSGSPSTFLSAMARITGAVRPDGMPLVFNVNAPSGLSAALVDAIEVVTSTEIDITLDATTLPTGLSFAFAPNVVEDVGPGESAAFDVTFTGDGSPISGTFDLLFKNAASNNTLGTIPVSVTCDGGGPVSDTTPPVCSAISVGASGPFLGTMFASFTAEDPESGIAGLTYQLQNAEGFYDDGSGATQAAGTVSFPSPVTGSLTVGAEKVDNSARARIVVVVENGEGLTRTCDPVMTNVGGEQPDRFALDQNYPNPFNPSTTISFSVPEAAFVTLEVYDVLGRRVATLVRESVAAGQYEVTWNARSDAGQQLAGGVYLYKLQAGDYLETRQMTLLK